MKNTCIILVFCWLASSCATGYGCPYSSNKNTNQQQNKLTTTFEKEAVLTDQTTLYANTESVCD